MPTWIIINNHVNIKYVTIIQDESKVSKRFDYWVQSTQQSNIVWIKNTHFSNP